MQIPGDTIHAQPAKILASPRFAHSERMRRFLRFAVEQQMAGRRDEIKEHLVAIEVFDKGPSFDPRIDPTVRVEARRLRSKLDQYHEQHDFARALFGLERPGPGQTIIPELTGRYARPLGRHRQDRLLDPAESPCTGPPTPRFSAPLYSPTSPNSPAGSSAGRRPCCTPGPECLPTCDTPARLERR